MAARKRGPRAGEPRGLALAAVHSISSRVPIMGYVRQACVLVGGRGTRLGDLARAAPKPLLDIGDNTAFLDLILEQLARQGFDDIILLAGHLGHVVQERYDGRLFGAARVRVTI